MAVQWETAMMSSQTFAAVVYGVVETYFASFGSSFVDSGVDRQLVLYLIAVHRQLVLYHVAILVFPFFEPHLGAVFRG